MVLGQELLPGSVTTLAVSRVAGPVIATTQTPQSLDPDKPAKLPSPRQNVNAKFNAASNSLGVDATKRSVGVGTLPKLTFSQNIVNKAAVERHLVVSAQYPNGSIRPVAGAWGWVSERSVVFRPRDYWPGNSTIRIVADLSRVVLGKSGGKSLVGSKKMNTTYQFKTARKFVARVDGATKKMKVYIDGEKVQTFPVSLGKNVWETRNGTKVVSTAKEPNKIYRSESLGLTAPEDQYELAAPWNTRLTPTGEFIHAAPWAYGRLGRSNGSHGCTNMYTADAEWFYKNTIPGDVVFYTNTGGSNMEPWNGPGGLWNVPWSTWIKKSALASGTNSIDTNVNAGTGSLAAAKPASA
jgi:lipoprotein-anchoring transpeptidase ErfK/SrfK